MKKVLQLKGLDCANCARELEEEIAQIDGVSFANIAFVNQKLTVEYTDDSVLTKIMDTANHFEEVKVIENTHSETVKSFKKEWLFIVISAFLFAVGIILTELVNYQTANIIGYLAFACSYLLVGYPVLISTAKNIVKGRIFDENFLMTLASIGAVLIGEIFEGVAVMLLYQTGETLQGMAVRASRRNILSLMDLKSEYATLLVNEEGCHDCACGHHHSEHTQTQRQVSPETLRIGDILLVKTGDKIPVDGVLLDEQAILDTKPLTGEPQPRSIRKAEEVLSGCINIGAPFRMQATRAYQDSAVSRILEMVENASASKAKPEKFISKFAKYYTPIVCGIALFIALFVPLLSGVIIENRLYFKDFTRWAQSALTFLVISCPCALVISVPLTYFSGIGASAKQGVLIKGATYLDALARANVIALDKTGTLTEGNFTVCAVHAKEQSKNELLSLVASVESASAHPIAKAFEKYEITHTAKDITEIAGRGIKASVQGETVLVGNAKLMQENGIEIQEIDSPYTVIYIAKNGVNLGSIEVGDKLRAGTKSVVSTLKELGFSRIAMLTGDTTFRAEKIAKEVGVYEVNANLLPDEKLKKAEELKKSGTLVYVGDGINDAPVMATSDIAVSMGKLGSAVAVEASDVVLISDNLSALPKCIQTARKTRKVVWQNVVFSIGMKIAFMLLGVIGILPLYLAVFADVGVMLLAVGNSFRVRKIS